MRRGLPALLVLACAGLAHAQDPNQPEREGPGLLPLHREAPPVVQDIAFVENKKFFRIFRGTNDNNVRVAMQQQEAAWGAYFFPLRYWRDRPELDVGLLQEDAWRVELWYAHHGFFDARVTGWEIRTVREPWLPWFLQLERFRAPSVRVVGFVDEGEVSVVRNVEIEGIDIAGGALRLKIDRSVADIQGDPFDLETAKSLANLVENELHDRSYARAKAEITISAHPEDHAVDLRIVAVPGPACDFGPVTLTGLVEVEDHLVRDQIRVEEGRAYSPQKMRDTQANLFNLGTFSVVQVVPDLSGEGSVIPITVQVSETRFRRLRVGGGIAKAPNEFQVRASSDLTHTNLGHQLINLETSVSGGYTIIQEGADLKPSDIAEILSLGDDSQDVDVGDVADTASGRFSAGPFLDLEATLRWPRFAGKPKLSVNPAVGFEIGTDIGQTYRYLEISPAFTWQISKHMALTPSYHFERWNTDRVFTDTGRPQLGTKDQFDEYTLHYVKAQLVIDRRDHPIYTRRGYYGSFSVLDAGAPVFPGFTFAKMEFDLRRYWSVVRPIRSVAAVHVGGGVARPYAFGDSEAARAEAVVPYNDLFFLGGPASVRGWAQDMMGPRSCYRQTSADTLSALDCADIRDLPRSELLIYPLGNQAVLWTNLEYRITGPFSIDYAAFTDIGFAWSTLDQLVAHPLSAFQPSVGVGMRYRSPVGPLRVDVGVRLREPTGDYVVDRRWGLHLALSEVF